MLCAVCCVLYVQEEGRREAHLSCVDRGFTGRTYGSDAGERERHSHIPILCAVYCLLRGVWCVVCGVSAVSYIANIHIVFSLYLHWFIFTHGGDAEQRPRANMERFRPHRAVFQHNHSASFRIRFYRGKWRRLARLLALDPKRKRRPESPWETTVEIIPSGHVG